MRNLLIRGKDGSYIVKAALYGLRITGHEIEVFLDNNRYAVLDVRCCVPKTREDEEGALPDEEPNLPRLVSVQEEADKAVFRWENESTLWGKTYTLVCDWLRFTFSLQLCGRGPVDEIYYFSGNMAGEWGSVYEFQEGFTPCISWYNEEDYTFRASTDCHRWSVLMAPPMFCYAFRRTGSACRLGLGLVAGRGEHNFHSFDYRCHRAGFRTGFALVTDQHGHTKVDGVWEAPSIVGYAGDDQWDVLRQYTDSYLRTGIARPRLSGAVPRFWYGPLICGWIEQMARAAAGEDLKDTDLARQDVYEEIAASIRKYGLHPSALIIDDKWQSHYATDVADPEKWPDLRGFVDARHREGIRTLLWFKLWDPDGWDPGLCVTTDEGNLRIDPSHPAFLANLEEVLHRILSSEEGCYDCDGLKLDFAMFNPVGRKVHTCSGKYGVELLYDMQAFIYKKAKEIKPECLINASPCHPYFAHICDQARLHDYDPRNRNNREDMTMRARLFDTAMPGVLLDTDNAGFADYRDTMHWLLCQPLVGVPDLYSLIPTGQCALEEADFRAIAQLWDEYNARIDATIGNRI